jgi:glycosyltransferase involved in cell wall biosynthesis
MSSVQAAIPQELLRDIRNADILIGIPSLNNADTIDHTVKTIRAGLERYFPGKKTLIFNVDAGSSDGTRVFTGNLSADEHCIPLLSYAAGRETGIEGPAPVAEILATILYAARALNVSACAIIDPAVRSITQEWIALLLAPVEEGGYDCVVPVYKRKRHEGGITESILYPVSRALYGKRVRQPIGGNFGLSGSLVDHLLESGIVGAHHTGYGADLWVTTTAAARNFKICETFLGERIYGARRTAEDLSQTIFHALVATFDLMEKYAQEWRRIKGSEAVPVLVPEAPRYDDAAHADTGRMIERFRLGVKELVGFWKGFLSREAIQFLQKSAALRRENFFFDDEIWAEIIFSFSLAYHNRIDTREHILKSLTPVYLGRTAAFIMETLELDAVGCEKKTEKLCRAFEEKKFFLLVNWR